MSKLWRNPICRLFFIVSVSLLALIPANIVSALPVMEQWEALAAGDDAEHEIYGNIWAAQTFTVTDESHSIEQVRFLAYREGSPGTMTIVIKSTSASLPTGADLTSGTTNATNFSTSAAGVWYSIDLTEYSLEPGMYAIVFKLAAGDASNSVHLRYDTTAAGYADGERASSTNGGTTWATDAADDFMFGVWGKSLIELSQAKVFRGYLEDNDMLITVQGYDVYVPYYPSDDSAVYFDIQLRSTDGATILANSAVRSWGNKPSSIYLSANMASGLTSGLPYRIYIYGQFGANPFDYYTLQPTDWRGDDLALLDVWILNTANDISNYYGVDLMVYIGGIGQVLNDEGGIMFDIGIPGLSDVRPDIFKSSAQIPDEEDGMPTHAFDTSSTWDARVGVQVAGILTSLGDFVGVDGDAVGAFAIVGLYLVLAVGIIAAKGHPAAAFGLGVPIFLAGGWFLFIPFALMGILTAACAFLAILSLFVYRT